MYHNSHSPGSAAFISSAVAIRKIFFFGGGGVLLSIQDGCGRFRVQGVGLRVQGLGFRF